MNQDYIALDWVKGEIEETLQQAQQSLEDYVENPEDKTRLKFCLNYLHQVHGTLTMVEFYGAALLAEEMEAVANDLANNKVTPELPALEILMQAILQLPHYLEHIKIGRRDLPVVLLPILNELRAARGETFLSETALFTPYIEANPAINAVQEKSVSSADFNHWARKVRQMLQAATLQLLQGKQPEVAKQYLSRVFARLHKTLGDTPQGLVWLPALAFSQWLEKQEHLPNSARQLLKDLDTALKDVIDHGVQAVNTPASTDLVKNLLFYVARTEVQTEAIKSVQARFKLDQALPSEEDIKLERDALSGPDKSTIDSVLGALNDEIIAVKDRLDLIIRGDGDRIPSLQSLSESIKQVSDTMGMLGLGMPRRVMQEQQDNITAMVNAGSAEDNALLDVAGALLYIEATLSGMRSEGNLEEQTNSGTLSDAQKAVIREARNVLENVKDAIIAYIANQWSIQEIDETPELLHSIEGSLAIIPLPEVADILAQAALFIQQHLITSGEQPQWSVMDNFADVLSGVEYFLERYSDSPNNASADLLTRVKRVMGELSEHMASGQAIAAAEEPSFETDPQALRYDDATGIDDAQAPAAQPEAASAELASEAPTEAASETPAEAPVETSTATAESDVEEEDDLIDDEIIEIFLEEAEEVCETIDEFWPQYKSNQDDSEAFTTVRRAFHTLKGSGRMVRANVIGELAWSIENLFNRVLDNTVEMSANVLDLADYVISQIPALTNDFKERQAPSIDTQPLMDFAHALAGGEDVSDFAAVIGQGDESTENEEISIELPEAPAEEMSIEAPVADEDADDVLVDIFINETESHLTDIHAFIEESQQSLFSNPLTDQLQRALHTIKGSAHMAGIESVAGIAHPLEKLIKELRSYQVSNNEAIVSLVTQGYDFIHKTIQDSELLAATHLEGTQEWLNALETLHDELISQAQHDGQSGQGPNPEAIAAFMSHGMDSLLDAERLLGEWQQQQDNGVLKAMRHDLQDVVQGAASAELSHIQLLANKLDDFYLKIEQTHLANKDDAIELASEAHEALLNMFDSLAAGQETTLPDALLEKLRNWQPAEEDLNSPEESDDSLPVAEVEETFALPEEFSTDAEPSTDEPSTNDPSADDISPDQASTDESENEYLVVNEDDSELLDIFLEESLEVMEAIEAALEEWRQNPDDLLQVAQLQRELHTLKGGARMTDLNAIADLCHELETLYEYISGGRLGMQNSLFSVFERAHDTLANQLDNVRNGFVPKPADALVKEINQLTKPSSSDRAADQSAAEPVAESTAAEDTRPKASAAEASEPAPVKTSEATPVKTSEATPDVEHSQPADTLKSEALDESDREILEIFLEEAAELHEALDGALHEWQEDPTQQAAPEEAQRILHTLKGGARLAGLTEIGHIAHDFENQILRAQQGHIDTDAQFYQSAYQQQDQLHAKVEQVAQVLAGGELIDLSEPELTFVDEAADAPASEEDEQSNAPAQTEAPAETSTESEPAAEKEPEQVPESTESNTSNSVVPLRPNTQPKAAPKPEVKPNPERQKAPQELVRVSADLLDGLVNLAGETSIGRGRMEQQVNDFSYTLEEMDDTLERLRDQLRRLDQETEAQVLFRQERQGPNYEDFDPLEMDRYSTMQQLSRALVESASDLLDLKETLNNNARDTETLLLQQSRVNSELQEGLMKTRMVPFQRLVPRLRRIVRQIGLELGKQVELNVRNAEGEMDRSILERLISPLEHMVRNSVDHGIESPEKRRQANKSDVGQVTLSISRDGGDVIITLADDGQGINIEAVKRKAIERGLMPQSGTLPDQEILQFILQAGFSTAEEVTQISGRGVGMDVVASEIKQMGGVINIDSTPGKGSTFTIRLPFTVSMNRALMIRMSDDLYAIPLDNIQGIVRVSAEEMRNIYEKPSSERVYHYAGTDYHVGYLGTFLDSQVAPNLEGQQSALPMLLVRGPIPFALQVDSLLGSREIVVKTLGPQFAGVFGVSGGSILGDGSVVIILDLPAMIRARDTSQYQQSLEVDIEEASRRKELENRLPRIIVVDDSVTVRKVTSRLLERHGMEVLTAKDGIEALEVLQDTVPDLMLLDIEMPRMDGFEVASQVRHDSRLKELPIIMITSRTGDKHRERAMNIGVNEYLGKPFQEDVLLTTINQLLGREVY